jgi:two-component system response regulator VicR
MNKILIIEDDRDMSEILLLYLRKNGFECRQAFDGPIAIQLAREYAPDLLVLDVELPGLNGIEVCKTLRQEMDTPILFLSGLGEERDKIRGLEAGGDDYVAKPFSLPELLARIRAALRRSGLPDASRQHINQIEFPGLMIDLSKAQATREGKLIELTQMEYQVLTRLARNPGWTFSNEQLFSLVWGGECIDTRTVAVHINRLRNKLGKSSSGKEYILTVWGKGYKFNDQL